MVLPDTEMESAMNNSPPLHGASSKVGAWPHVRLCVSKWITSAARRLWHASDIGPVVTFTTGVIVGLLIPSRNWVAIAFVIAAGVVLRRIIKLIDHKLGLGARDMWGDWKHKHMEGRDNAS